MLSHPSWFDFLRIESELALTPINLASSYSIPQNSARARGKASKALEQIERCLRNPIGYGLDAEDMAFLDRRCEEIESALNPLSKIAKRNIIDNSTRPEYR